MPCSRNPRDSHEDEVGVPEEEEGGQGPEGLADVGVVPPALGDGGPQLGVAEGPHHGQQPADHPHDQRGTHTVRRCQNALRGDENT